MASAKTTTRKLSGRAKDNFFEAGLTAAEAKAAVTSLRVRKDAWPVSRDLQRARDEVAAPPAKNKAAPASKAKSQPQPKPQPAPQKAPPAASPASSPAGSPQGDFDPFVFGLVPIFKREGAEGLVARLNEIVDVENLRAMAKAQQIVLPRDVRRGEVAIDTVRTAVLAAVEQRITDRKAQL